MASRIEQLKALSSKFPAANQQVAAQKQAGRAMQLQQAVGQAEAPKPGSITSTAQQVGAQQTAQAGQIQSEAAQKGLAQTAKTREMVLGEQQMAASQRVADRSINLSGQSRKMENDLSKIDQNVKNTLVDKQLKFNKDEANRTLFNTRQLADWSVLKAENKHELESKMRTMKQISDKKLQRLDLMKSRITSELQLELKKGNQERNQERVERLYKAKRLAEKQYIEEKREAQGKANIWSTGMELVFAGLGAGVGAVVAGPAGAGAGAMTGAGIGRQVGGALAPSFQDDFGGDN